MLEVQKYLRSGKTLEDLKSEFCIESKKHPIHPIAILDYSQIDSPKTHPIVIECRSLVIELDTWNIVSGCMRRFFNLDEVPRIQRHFNWDNYKALEKIDGSLISIFTYNKEIIVRTRFSWADSIVGLSDKTWEQLVLECLTDIQIGCIKANPTYTFVFELCSPWNQVVVYHETSKLVLTTIIENEDNKELYYGDVEVIAQSIYFNRPQSYDFESIDDLFEYVNEMEASKLTDEGFVLTDNSLMRFKIKNRFYLQLHRLNNNGNIASDKILVDIILKGEADEIIIYYPHLKERIEEIKIILKDEYNKLHNIWFLSQDISEQKKFAIYITKENKTPFSGIIFELRKKYGQFHSEIHLMEKWLESKELILKVLFNKG